MESVNNVSYQQSVSNCVLCRERIGIYILYTTTKIQGKRRGRGRLTQKFPICAYCLMVKVEGIKEVSEDDFRGINSELGEDEKEDIWEDDCGDEDFE